MSRNELLLSRRTQFKNGLHHLPGHYNGIGKFSQLLFDKVSSNKLPDEIATPKKGK